VMICLPWYRFTEPRVAFALMSMLDRRRMSLSLSHGDAFIAHSRNKLADQFLRSKQEWSIWQDEDNVPPFANAPLYNSFTGFNLPEKFAGMHGIDRLISHGKTLIGGMYRGRWEHSKPIFAEGAQLEKRIEEGPRDCIRQTQWAGFGWVAVHRSVFLDIEKRFPHLARKADGTGGNWFTSSEHDLTHAAEEVIKALDSDTPPSPKDAARKLEAALNLSKRLSPLQVGEDVIFCRRAAQAGHPCFLDEGCVVGHLGQFCYGYPTKKRIL